MGARGSLFATALVLASAFVVAGCGDSGDRGTQTGSDTLTVYSGLPLQGPSRVQSLSIINAEKLALEQAGARVGKFTIKYVSLDDSRASSEGWDPGVTISNARKVVQDKSTIAYLGDFDSGASAISLPLLNQASILQISPSNSAVGLTQVEAADKGEPEKYYPSGKRTFGRVVPSDKVQASVQVSLQEDQACTKTYLVNDGGIEGQAITRSVAYASRDRKRSFAGGGGLRTGEATYAPLADEARESGADCVFVGANDAVTAVQLFKDLHAAMPTAKLLGSAGLATPGFAAALEPDVAAVTYLTSPALAPKLLPPSGRRFFRDYVAKYDEEPLPYAIYGYEAMRAALASIRAAGKAGNDRLAVTQAFFRTKARRSPVGTYSIDPGGDTSMDSYGVYRIADGRLKFDRTYKAR